ncbi:MAG: response regulator [Betaproteobacteria bacterium]|nr:MAG: response regulator [Betaproteobacteria bacterium]
MIVSSCGWVPRRDWVMSSIVIIDDDALMRSLLAEWLTAEGYRVKVASNESSQSTPAVDLLIIDVYMPRHVGVERLRRIQRAYPGVPIIAISGQFRAGVECEGLAARSLGVHGVIAKPFGRRAFLEAVRSVIGPRRVAAG